MPIHPLQILQSLEPVQTEDPIKRAGTLEALRNTMGQGLIQQQTIAANADAARTRQAGIAADAEVAQILKSAQFDADGNLDPATEAALVKNGSPHAQAILTNISTVSGRKSNIQRDTALTQQGKDTLAEQNRHNLATETAAANAAANVPAGNTRIGPDGKVIYQAPPAERPDTSITPFEAWQKQNPGKPIGDWISLNEKATAAGKIGTRAVQTMSNGERVTRIVPDIPGSEFPSQPNATQQTRDTALKNINPVLDSISELSEKINTGKGLEAKAQGEAAKLAAKANYNDDVAEYEAIISGFTPMVARAVGHTGVLTQQDVDSVRELFPKPGDSKTLRDRKIARVKSILAGTVGGSAQVPENTRPRASDGKGNFVEWDGKAWVPAK